MHSNDNNNGSFIFVQSTTLIYLCPIDHTKPFSSADHMGPQSIIKEKVWEDVIPPAMVSGHLVLPLLASPMEGILGDL